VVQALSQLQGIDHGSARSVGGIQIGEVLSDDGEGDDLVTGERHPVYVSAMG
jgi:hypothetical protein